MKTLKIWFENFWGLFDKRDNFFTYVLSHKYKLILTNENPDIVIHGGPTDKYPNSLQIYYSGEPYFTEEGSEYQLTSFYSDKKNHFRIPLFLLYNYDYYKHKIIPSLDYILNRSPSCYKEKFCTFLAQGGGNNPRKVFFDKLNKLERVDACGSYLNNSPIVGGEPGTTIGSINKINHLKNYCFTMAFENSEFFSRDSKKFIGYTTEKIFEPFIAGSVPIYWGNPLIELDFNVNSFIKVQDFKSLDETVDKVLEIYRSKRLYEEYISSSCVTNPYLFDINYAISIF